MTAENEAKPEDSKRKQEVHQNTMEQDSINLLRRDKDQNTMEQDSINLLRRDKAGHSETARLLKTRARPPPLNL